MGLLRLPPAAEWSRNDSYCHPGENRPKRQAGFTLIELVIAVALVALITLAGSISLGQIYKVTALTSNWSHAIREAQNVAYWISADALMTDSISFTAEADKSTPGDFMTLVWKEWETGETYKTIYSRAASGSLLEIQRRYIVRDVNGAESETTGLIAKNISEVWVEWDNIPGSSSTSLKLTVTARSGDKSATREYLIYPRVQY